VSVQGVCDEPGVDLFVEACRNQGLSPVQIQSLVAEYELEIKTQPLTEQEIEKQVEAQIPILRKQMALAVNDAGRRLLEEAIRDLPARIRSGNLGISRSRTKILFRENGNGDGWRRQEVLRFDAAANKWKDKPDVLLQSALDGGDNVVWQAQGNLAMVMDTPWSWEEIRGFGRIQGPPYRFATVGFLAGTDPRKFEFSSQAITLFKSKIAEFEAGGQIAACRLTGDQKYDGDAVAKVVESSKSIGGTERVNQRYWIDPARGYVCPLVELHGETGQLGERWKSSDYFRNEPSGLWFPSVHVHTRFDPESGRLVEERTYRLSPRSLRVNQPISDAEFAVKLPSRASVLDARGSKRVQYEVTQSTTLSLAQGSLDLASMPGLHLVSSVAAEGAKGRSLLGEWISALSWKHWLAAANSLILLALLGVLARKMILARRRQRDLRGRRDRR
jgi:hypothetical protein